MDFRRSFKNCLIIVVFVGFKSFFGISGDLMSQNNNKAQDNVADWTLFVYMESDKELNDAALKNISDIARSYVAGNINVVIQLHAWQEIAWRYKVVGNSIIFDSAVDLTLEPEQDLVNGLEWAFGNFRSKYKMVVLWNHGFGILDPVWSENEDKWIPEIAQDSIFTRSKLISETFEHCNHKGVLFYPNTKIFLNNQAMINAFQKVKTGILENQKIDIISFDACRMSMIEIGYQLADFAHYLIGSQDCELKDGCDYFSLIKNLAFNKEPINIAKSMIVDYEKYYKPRGACGRYTQSALNLDNIDLLVKNLDQLVSSFIEIKNSNSSESCKQEIIQAITNARKVMPEFCRMPSYIDICSFYLTLREEFLMLNGFENIIKIIDNGLNIVKNIIIANTCGFKSSHCYGISIYYPFDYKECSYAQCLFAQNSLWIKFLENFAVNIY